jgi:hypothetical protein
VRYEALCRKETGHIPLFTSLLEWCCGMRVQKNGTVVGIAQSEDPVKVRLQVKFDEEMLEQRVKPFPQSEQERMAQQMTQNIAKQLRGAMPGAVIMGPGFTGAPGPNIEEWLVPADQAAKLSIGKRVRVTLEFEEE